MRCSISFLINALAPISGCGDTAAAPALARAPDVFLCAAVDPRSQKRMVEFLKGALKVVKFFREAPGAEDNALERELAPLIPWQSVRVMST